MTRRAPVRRRASLWAPKRIEKHEQRDGVQLLESLGARVFVSGTRRRKGDYQGTMQTPGIPDVEAFLPRPKFGPPTTPARTLLKWEAKSATRTRLKNAGMTPEQVDYRDLCRQTGAVQHLVGDLSTLYQFLVHAGYLRAEDVPHDRLAPTQGRLEDR